MYIYMDYSSKQLNTFRKFTNVGKWEIIGAFTEF